MSEWNLEELRGRLKHKRARRLLADFQGKIDDGLLYVSALYLESKYLYHRTRFIDGIDIRYIDAFCLYLASAFPDKLKGFIRSFHDDSDTYTVFNMMFSSMVNSLGEVNYGDDYSRGLLSFLEPLDEKRFNKTADGLIQEQKSIDFLYGLISFLGEATFAPYVTPYGFFPALKTTKDFTLLDRFFLKGSTIVIIPTFVPGQSHQLRKKDDLEVLIQIGKPGKRSDADLYVSQDAIWRLARDYSHVAYDYFEDLGEMVFESEGQSDRNQKDFRRLLGEETTKLSLFTGNGVSIDFGSDRWDDLSKTLIDYLQPYYLDDVEEMERIVGGGKTVMPAIAKSMIDPDKYLDAIHHSIYRKYETQMHTNGTLLRAVSKVKISYPECRLFTYNYDEFLEIDYAMATNGKRLCPIGKDGVKPRKCARYLSEEKMAVYHVHGYLPYGDTKSCQGLVLGEEEYQQNYKRSKWTWRIQDQVFSDPDSLILFVGSSLTDAYQLSMIRRAHQFTRHRIFALVSLNREKPKEYDAALAYYRKQNIRLITVDDYSKLPGQLLKLFGLA